MGFEDKTLQCADCGASFVFSAAEQEFYQSKGFSNEPKRCPQCRSARKTQRGGTGGGFGGGERRMYSAICASCGKECQVPFQPRGDSPVYCTDCFAKVRQSRQR